MRKVEAVGVVHADHQMTILMPADVPVGSHQVVLEFHESHITPLLKGPRVLSLCPHDIGPVNPLSTYRREDIYDNER